MRTFTFILLWAFSVALRADVSFPLRSNDVVAFVGGADVSSAQQGGQLESLLACAWPTARFRNFGWEGDTVYAQPRDFNFPPLTEHLRKAGATVIVLQFGRTEALAKDAPDFRAAYEALITKFQSITPRLVLVAPPPFENAGGLLPNLAKKTVAWESMRESFVSWPGRTSSRSSISFPPDLEISASPMTAFNSPERAGDLRHHLRDTDRIGFMRESCGRAETGWFVAERSVRKTA